MKWGIITTIIIGIVLAGVYGAAMAHGEEAQVSTSAYVLKNNVKVNEVSPGDAVKIAVKVKNTGDVGFPLSGQAPAYAYANIYKITIDGMKKVQSVEYKPKYVMFHTITLQPGQTYTSYIDWNVPDNVSGMLYIEAWTGSAPTTSFTIEVNASSTVYDNSNVYVYTDSLVYSAGDVVHIEVVNYGNSTARFGSGFAVVNDNGERVVTQAWRHLEVLQPGESVEYTWTVPNNLDSGWYYIYSFANDNYETIFIY